jgi:glycosyltransferase involved in cell wall biosynthesis
VCGIRPEKDLPTLMRAVARLRTELPGLRLVLVGSGSAEPEIEALRTGLKIEDICLRVPQTAATQPWLQAIDIFVLPSTSEAVSNALLEAMSSRCAVVASRIGGNVEVIEDGVSGFLFAAGEVETLANILRRLALDGPLRQRMSEAALRRVEEVFSPTASVNHLTAVYSKLL